MFNRLALSSGWESDMYVVYNEDTTRIVEHPSTGTMYYKRFSDAKHFENDLNSGKRHAYRNDCTYRAVHVDFHRLYVRHKKMVHSVRFGNMVEEWSDIPYYVSVGSNAYWES